MDAVEFLKAKNRMCRKYGDLPEVDWSKVAVDTPILVRDRDGDAWRPRYFAKYENDQICTWGNGATSWSGDGSMSCWNEAKLAEDDNGK